MSTTGTRVVEFRVVLRLIALCAFPAMVGCGVAENMEKAARNSAERDNVGPFLKAFHGLYVDFHDTNRRGPADWKELEAYATKAGNVQAVQNAQQLGCEVAWGTGFRGLPIGTQEYVLAHRPQDLQDDGGYVLFLDGSTWFLKAAEEVEVLELLPNDFVRIRWLKWGPSFDQTLPRSALQFPANATGQAPPAASPAPPPATGGGQGRLRDFAYVRRPWTDAAGKYQVTAELVDYKDGQVTLRREDGGLVTLPVEKLSRLDQVFLQSASRTPGSP